MIWPRVIGQQRVKQMLISSLKGGRLAHAYLFHGGEGVGKDAMAMEFARVIECERGGDSACDECPSCLRMNTLQHPDVQLIIPLPVGKGEQAGDPPLSKLAAADVETVREEYRLKAGNPYHAIAIPRAAIIKTNSIRDVRRESSMATFGRGRRVFIISQADRMGDEAANTLLKTLEEPPESTLLILTTAHRDALLPTILSRCQNVLFDPLTVEEIRSALVTRNGVSEEEAVLPAQLANGSYGRAVTLLDEGVRNEREAVVHFIQHALGTKTAQLIAVIDDVAESKDRARVVRFLVLMMMWFRDALRLSLDVPVLNADQTDLLRRFITKFPDADLLQVIGDIENTISLVDRNVYIKLALLQLAVRLRSSIVPLLTRGSGVTAYQDEA